MIIRPSITALICLLSLSALPAFADETRNCNEQQKSNCERFCAQHGNVQSCVVDITKRDGTCTCADGTSHTKSR